MTDVTVNSSILRWYRKPALTENETSEKLETLKKLCPQIEGLDTELCYHVEVQRDGLTQSEEKKLEWILSALNHSSTLQKLPHLSAVEGKYVIIEYGPRFNFSTAESSNSVSICRSIGLKQIVRIEVSTRFQLAVSRSINSDIETQIADQLYDRMTQCRYTEDNIPKCSFNETLHRREDIKDVDIMKHGRKALEEINDEMGLAFDKTDLDYYTNLFKDVLKRNPTNIECFDLAQSNSEHSRHWFFKGKMIIDGVEHSESLIDMIVKTQDTSNPNNVIKFSDNSSAIKGYDHKTIRPLESAKVSKFIEEQTKSHLIFTAETHNFPTGVAPFSGATTGTGGRIRDVEAVGRGGYCIAGTAGYSTGNLFIPDYDLPWEDSSFKYPHNFAPPLEIIIEASNGASDYGNKFGEPVICGFLRTCGMHDNSGERREWIKPIMFSGGVGYMEASMVDKLPPEQGMEIVKIGGPVYRIGVGGGAASSVHVQGDNKSDLDFNAVQRGDAEMENKLNRVVRACLEQKLNNPITSIHDQGAGGNGNVLKELVEPVGGVIYANRFQLGDPTINALELWGAEYQENNALLCRKENADLIKTICNRERCPVNFVGQVEATGSVVLALDETMKCTPFNLKLDYVLGKMPRKVFNLSRKQIIPKQLIFPTVTVFDALNRVLRLPAVGSKRFLTNKVDRCVTGLVAQQQCVGPLHTPLADVAVTAISYLGHEGVATAIGEQPIKGLLNTAAGARMTVAESLTNLVFAAITDIKDVKCSGNWMWAAKLPGEGAALYDACVAMCDVMEKLGVAVDGGKDSLSMAARVGNETVKAPGTLVVSTYAPCPDIRNVITPDIKAPARNEKSHLLFIDLSGGKSRLGGSALAQCFKQLGDSCPDLDDSKLFVSAFNATQHLIKQKQILSGHDISDGGLITCLLEMGFGGISGFDVNIKHKAGNALEVLFAEEVGWVLEVSERNLTTCVKHFNDHNVQCYDIGQTNGFGMKSKITVRVNNEIVIESNVFSLMQIWEETSYRLELRQAIHKCVEEEFNSLAKRTGPKYQLTFNPDNVSKGGSGPVVRVAVIREEGTNGDREMAAALMAVGFEVWDVTMQDLQDGTVNLDQFRGVIFPGGFSYADVLGSARGWAASIIFNEKVNAQFEKFISRSDTFSLGVCNGCQLMSLIGWVGAVDKKTLIPDIRLDHNTSGRFECRWTTVKIEKSKSIMLREMEGSVMGVWAAHAEGRFEFENKQTLKKLETDNCIALRYVDDDGQPTEAYPMNPNGSVNGLAGVCSVDGRHLAMMPHPERCFLPFQCPYVPEYMEQYQNSPWLRMFKNAYDWCINK